MTNNYAMILKAASFAADKHRTQRRKGTKITPYINHPLDVARILTEEGRVVDTEIIAASLLHDTIEDTKTTAHELRRLFGKRVTALVVEVTDDKSLEKEERKRQQIVKAPHKSPEAALIKLADKISNVRDVGERPAKGWSESRRIEYLDWAQQVVNALPVENQRLKTVFRKAVKTSLALIQAKDGQQSGVGQQP